jgi:type I restriction enzyme M protein
LTDVVGKLWGFCNTLRHDGIGYGDYIEQLTYLLFLKLADEKGVDIPAGYGWRSLRAKSGTDLLDHYVEVLRRLGKERGILGDVFAGALSKFREPLNLRKLISMIDAEEWGALDVDLKAQAYEGLLQKYAAEQKGAGQYFTPREAIRAVVRCMKPDIRAGPDFTIHDPACGTGGFLIGAYEWQLNQTKEGADLTLEERRRLRKLTFSGGELVLETRRLALMNLYLHEIEADIYYGDSLAEGPYAGRRYDCVMTNPPFGTRGAGEVPNRADFTVRTSNKQLNFIQHVINILKPGGRAAVVVPDNVLFEEHAGREIRKILMQDCDLHTILRLPIGTFTPYSPGVQADIIFFVKGHETKEVWVFDLRTNIEKVAKRNPLTADYFKEFEESYGSDPDGHPRRRRDETERLKRFTRKQISDRNDNLDITWLTDSSTNDSAGTREPEEIVAEVLTSLQTAQDALEELAVSLDNNRNQKARNTK